MTQRRVSREVRSSACRAPSSEHRTGRRGDLEKGLTILARGVTRLSRSGSAQALSGSPLVLIRRHRMRNRKMTRRIATGSRPAIDSLILVVIPC
jgi:hypothetical protein